MILDPTYRLALGVDGHGINDARKARTGVHKVHADHGDLQ
jgi:hypothetical protein